MVSRAYYCCIFIFTLFSLFFTSQKAVVAQIDPFPSPTPIPCNEFEPDEFHSLRPYQASPCNPDKEDLALFCGNDFILIDTIVIDKNYSDGSMIPSLDWEYIFEGNPITPDPDPCTANSDGTETCTFIVERVEDIAIDLEQSELPIMGYTEPSIGNETDPFRVINSRFQDETVADAQKVNEYASWYMNGLIGRAEYDPPEVGILGIGGLTNAGEYRVVNFSGPLKRLLSWESQIVRRIDEVDKAQTSLSPACDPNAIPGDPNCIRHDQIIGCTNLLGHPAGCYTNVIKDKIRLSDWFGNLPPLQRDFGSFDDFWIAYQDWRADNPWRLFSYIPFSSTEDRVGELEMEEYASQPVSSGGVFIIDTSILSQTPADLFFAHMQENFELADLFQQIYSPEGADLNGPPQDVFSEEHPFCDIVDVRTNPGDNLHATDFFATVSWTAQVSCIFTLPGEGRVCNAATGADVDAGEDNCFSLPHLDWDCDTYYGQVDCDAGEFCGVGCGPWASTPGCLGNGELCEVQGLPYPDLDSKCCGGLSCSGDTAILGNLECEPVSITVSPFNYTESCTNSFPVAYKVITKTPLAEEVWSKLVAGPSSVFRRFFPKIQDEEGTPIRSLLDLPAMTNAVYQSLGGLPVYAGDPAKNRPGSQAEIYFPHLGGVHQYFLKCTQTLLRPKGFGEACPSGESITEANLGLCSDVTEEDIPDEWLPAYGEGSLVKEHLISSTACSATADNLADECYYYVVKSALDAGVNPAFALSIWTNESGCSNYNLGAGAVYDFGISWAPQNDFFTQLAEFLQLPNGQGYWGPSFTWCMDQSTSLGFDSRTHAFLALFQSGQCLPGPDDNPSGYQYYIQIGGVWSAIVWDNSCPLTPDPKSLSCPK